MYNWWDECVRRCPQIGNGSGHIYNNYYSGDDSFLPNSCNQIISGEGSNMVSENCRFQAVSGREIIVQPVTSPYRDNGSYTAKNSSETPTKLNYTAKVTSTWNPKDNYGYTLLDAYNASGTDTKDFCTKYAGAASSSGELKYITDSSMQTFAATVYTAPFLTDSFDSAYGNPVTNYTPAVLQEGAVYMIQNVNSGLYLEVDGGKAADGTNVQQWGANEPAAHNTWRVLSDGDGYYTLYPQIGDKVSYLLDVAGNAAANGTNLGIWSATDADAQRFKFYEAADGVYYLLTKTSGDQSCVAVQAASTSAGANVVEWAVNLSDTSQQWKLTQVEDTGCVMDTTKTYQFRNANSNLYLEVANGKAEDGSNVQQWGANEPAAHNSWTLKEFGGGHFAMIAGPCSVESEEQIVYVAKAVKAAGAQLLRGGAFKPRTSPYDFQGLHGEGIRLLEIAKQETGLPIVTELMNIKHLPLFENVDVIQIGARNMQNYDLLKEMGSVKKPILLKRGLANTLKELLMSAEYIMASGNDNVILCERGIRTFDDYTRNTLDLAAVPMLHELSHLPVIVDPSHSTGINRLVPPMTLAAAACGADGVIVEVHNDPIHALCDGAQSLTCEQFAEVARKVRAVREAVAE